MRARNRGDLRSEMLPGCTGVPPIVTLVVLKKYWPWTVTLVPPAVLPPIGVIADTVGAGYT